MSLPFGDTVSSIDVLDAVDAELATRAQSRASVRFDIGGSLFEWQGADEWLRDAHRDGYTLTRYILLWQPSGDLVVDLAAIRPLESEIDPNAV